MRAFTSKSFSDEKCTHLFKRHKVSLYNGVHLWYMPMNENEMARW